MIGKKLLSSLILESGKQHHCGSSTLLGTEDAAGGPSSVSCLFFLVTVTLVAYDARRWTV